MAITAFFAYEFFIPKIGEKLALIFASGIALVTYLILIFILQIFSKEEIGMIPYGKKVYEVLHFAKKIKRNF